MKSLMADLPFLCPMVNSYLRCLVLGVCVVFLYNDRNTFSGLLNMATGFSILRTLHGNGTLAPLHGNGTLVPLHLDYGNWAIVNFHFLFVVMSISTIDWDPLFNTFAWAHEFRLEWLQSIYLVSMRTCGLCNFGLSIVSTSFAFYSLSIIDCMLIEISLVE